MTAQHAAPQRIWITGASSGIGAELARQLAQQGAELLISARREGPMKALQQQFPQQIQLLPLDLCDAHQVAAATEVLHKFGPLDWVIANAGTCEYLDVANFDPQLFQRVMATNFNGTVNTIHLALPGLRAAARLGRRPRLAAVSSSASWFPFPRAEAYGASKAAVDYLIRALRADLASEQIDVTLISPGFVRTPLTDRNDFAMPGQVSVEQAAQCILKGLHHHRLQIAFPRRFIWPLKLLSALPESLIFALSRRLSRNRTHAADS